MSNLVKKSAVNLGNGRSFSCIHNMGCDFILWSNYVDIAPGSQKIKVEEVKLKVRPDPDSHIPRAHHLLR
jgi:hypothetical protein